MFLVLHAANELDTDAASIMAPKLYIESIESMAESIYLSKLYHITTHTDVTCTDTGLDTVPRKMLEI